MKYVCSGSKGQSMQLFIKSPKQWQAKTQGFHKEAKAALGDVMGSNKSLS